MDVTLAEPAEVARELVLLEGLHAVKHARRFGAAIERVQVADRATAVALAGRLAPDLVALLRDADEVGADGITGLTPRPVRTGVVATARRPAADLAAAMAADGSVVLLDRPRDPGNAGAVIRVAAAAGAAAVVFIGDLDPWHPVCVRGAAGLQFAQPVLKVDELPASLGGRALVAVDPGGTTALGEAGTGPGRDRVVYAFGTERDGLSRGLLARADRTLAIPMRGGVSSLNLATAVAVVLYGDGALRTASGPAG